MVKINYLARMSYLRKHSKLFLKLRESLLKVLRLALLLKEEPCPVRLQMVFLK
jgi:hypothetical protein